MEVLKSLTKTIDEAIVAQHNFFRFEVPELFEYAIQKFDEKKSSKLLKVVFGVSFSTIKEIKERVKNGESFVNIMNDLNVRKLL